MISKHTGNVVCWLVYGA